MSSVMQLQPAGGFADHVFELLERVDYRLAATDEDKEAIYRLRYNSYLREKAILPSFSRRLADKFDDLDTSWLFGVFIDDQLVSSLRITVAYSGEPQSPCLEAFPDALESELEAGKIIVDPTRFVVDADASRLYPDLRFATTRIAWMASAYFGTDLLLASVRSEHQAFYRRVFGHRVVAPPREYATLIKPLSLMVCDYAANRDSVNLRYPFLRSSHFERHMLFEQAGRLSSSASAAKRDDAKPYTAALAS